MLIDCDVHGVVPAVEALIPYLDEHWREVIATSQFSGPTDQPHPPNVETSLRADLEPAEQIAGRERVADLRRLDRDRRGRRIEPQRLHPRRAPDHRARETERPGLRGRRPRSRGRFGPSIPR